MAMSTMTEPAFIALTVSAVISFGAAAPGISTDAITRSARRHSVSMASLVEKTVRTRALATRILFDGTRAVGVQYKPARGVPATAHGKEVICCGGAINTPQLLLLSGIGPADHLREVGVDVVHDLPGVGEGLQDHPLVPVVWNVVGASTVIW